MLDAFLICNLLWFYLANFSKCPRCRVLSCKLCQSFRGGEGVHHVPCSSGQGGTQMVCSYSKISSCGNEVAGVRGEGSTPRSPPSTGLGSAEAVHTDPKAKKFPVAEGWIWWFCTTLVVSGHTIWYASPRPWYPPAGFGACMMWCQCSYESLCAPGGREGGMGRRV